MLSDSIFIFIFQVTYDGSDTAMKHEEDSSSDKREYSCLVRVTDGKGRRFSTTVGNPMLILSFNHPFFRL